MTHRALAQEGPDLRREDISISPPRRRRHRHKGLARSRSNAVEDSRLGRLSHWPVLPRPQLAGFQVSTEGTESVDALSVHDVGSLEPVGGPQSHLPVDVVAEDIFDVKQDPRAIWPAPRQMFR